MPQVTIAFLGDVNGSPGRRVVEQQLPNLRAEHDPDLIIANVENTRSGSGLTPAQYDRFRNMGIDAMTLGDHAYREPRIVPILQRSDAPIARPANLSSKALGKRFIVVSTSPRVPKPVYIMTVLGRIFVSLPADDPFACVESWLTTLAERRPIVIIEAHMEATSEKIALARFLDGRVSAVLGTHTHVPTADARVLAGGTAFITDLGMCGPYDSVIGRDADAVIHHMTTGQHVPYAVANGDERMCGAIVRINTDTGLANSIERFEYLADHSAPPFSDALDTH